MKPYRNLHQGFAYPHLIALVKGIEPLRRPDISRLKYRGPFNHIFLHHQSAETDQLFKEHCKG
jgi:hypothetical protein